jgi:hypothetical protein
MRPILLALFAAALLQAQDIRWLFKEAQKSSRYRAVVERIEAEKFEKRAELFDPSYRIGGGVAYADEDGGDNGFEYEIGAGRDFYLGSLKGVFESDAEYREFAKKSELERIKVRLWRLYGNYCILLETLKAKGELGLVYDEIARQIAKGVSLGEFSASDAIMASLALDTLNLQITELETQIAQVEAGIRSIVPAFDAQYLCGDLRPDFDELFNANNSLLWSLMDAKAEAIRSQIATQKRVRLVGVDVGYSDELDAKRGSIALSIPLFAGPGAESKKAALLKRLSAALHTTESLKREYGEDTKVLHTRLRIYKEQVQTTERSIRLSADTLIRQSRMRFEAGEESLVQMLKAIETKLALIETILELKLKRHNAVADYMDKYAIDIERVIK